MAKKHGVGANDEDERAPSRLPVWETDGEGMPTITKYNPASFIIPGADHQGHSERVWCRVQPLIERQIDVILRSKRFPFRTKGDIVRWCVFNGIKQLDTLESVPNSFMGRIAIINDLVATESYYHEFMTTFGFMEEQIGKHMANNAVGEARRVLAMAKAHVLAMEEPYWREKCLKELKAKFGNILDLDKGGK